MDMGVDILTCMYTPCVLAFSSKWIVCCMYFARLLTLTPCQSLHLHIDRCVGSVRKQAYRYEELLCIHGSAI
jgi:hypothetical protein